MSKIKERLDKIIMDMDNSGLYDERDEAAIIECWNEALEALKAVVDECVSFRPDGYWYCGNCGWGKDRGHSSTCYVGKCQEALAKMEGKEKRGGFLDTAFSRDEEYDPADIFGDECL